MPYSGGLNRNIVQCLEDYEIPLKFNYTVVNIHGRERVEGVTVAKVDKNRKPIPGTEEYVECDTLLLSVGLIPENELSRDAGILIDRVTSGPVVNESMETSIEGIFACGNVVHVHDLVDYVTEESRLAGKCAAEYALNGGRKEETDKVKMIAGKGIRYVVPQLIRKDSLKGEVRLFFRVDDIYRDTAVIVRQGSKIIHKVSKKKVAPGEMESIRLKAVETDQLGGDTEIVVQLGSI
jgi:hypothetical protein